MFSSRTTRALRARIAVALLGTVASLAVPSFATAANGISAVPESAAGWEGDAPGRGATFPGWATLTCRPTNVMVTHCVFQARAHSGTANEFGFSQDGGDDFGAYNFENDILAGESKRLNIVGVFPNGDKVVEPNETLTVDIGMKGTGIGGIVIEPWTYSQPAQFTIWNDDYRPGQAPNPTAPRKTTCWTCR